MKFGLGAPPAAAALARWMREAHPLPSRRGIPAGLGPAGFDRLRGLQRLQRALATFPLVFKVRTVLAAVKDKPAAARCAVLDRGLRAVHCECTRPGWKNGLRPNKRMAMRSFPLPCATPNIPYDSRHGK